MDDRESGQLNHSKRLVNFHSQSGPESVMRGSIPASWCVRGLAQYILNVRAGALSGPDVLHDASQALLAHAFAFAKSDTYPGSDTAAVRYCVKTPAGSLLTSTQN